MNKNYKIYISSLLFSFSVFLLVFIFNSCSSDTITQIFVNEITAKDRLASANAQAVNKYGNNSKLIMIYGKNVKPNGTTDISAFSAVTSPDSIGAWLYIYRVPVDTSLRIFAPNPVPGSDNCIELTEFFDPLMLLNLIADTSARNIVSGALNVLITNNINITTTEGNLVDSDVSLGYANTSNPIKFNSNYEPSISTLNGNKFFQTGTNKTINMFLIPAAGTLDLPRFIQDLTGFPNDVWIVNYKKQTNTQTENLVLATVVESNQVMGITFLNFTSKAINISKFVNE